MTSELNDNIVIINWLPGDTIEGWDNVLAKVLEVFGLPGDRFTCHPTELLMAIKFKSKKDATLCRIMLSEHLRSPA